MEYKLEPLKNIQFINVSDFVFKTIRENIISWNLKPGTKVSTQEIAEALSVSRTPVVEAFKILEQQGVVKILSQRGTLITKINSARVAEEQSIRKSVEQSILAELMGCITDELLRDLEKNLDAQNESILASGPLELLKIFELDETFHKTIFSACQRSFSWDVIQNASGHYRRVRFASYWEGSHLGDILREHAKMYQAIKDKDYNELLKYCNLHIGDISTIVKIYEAKFPDCFDSI